MSPLLCPDMSPLQCPDICLPFCVQKFSPSVSRHASLPGEAVAAHPSDCRAWPLLAEGAEGIHAEDCSEVCTQCTVYLSTVYPSTVYLSTQSTQVTFVSPFQCTPCPGVNHECLVQEPGRAGDPEEQRAGPTGRTDALGALEAHQVLIRGTEDIAPPYSPDIYNPLPL